MGKRDKVTKVPSDIPEVEFTEFTPEDVQEAYLGAFTALDQFDEDFNRGQVELRVLLFLLLQQGNETNRLLALVARRLDEQISVLPWQV
jgi:hypothetical protein